MIEINLLPVREARRAADVRHQVGQLILALLVVLIAIGFVHSRINDRIMIAKSRVGQMRRDIDQFKPQLDQVAAFRKKKTQLEKKIDVIDELDRARSGPVRVMHELASRTPGRLWLKNLKTSGRRIEISGSSLDNELVAVFLSELGESEYFTDVELDGTKLNNKGEGLKLVDFSVHAKIASPKRKKAKSDEEKG